MPYATRQAMIERYGERELIDRTDRDEPITGAIVDTVLDRAAAGANAEVDAALRSRYAVPVEPPPPLLVDIACALTRLALWDYDVPETVKNRAREARGMLDRIATGKLVLDVPPATGGGSGAVLFAGPGRVFTDDTLKGF